MTIRLLLGVALLSVVALSQAEPFVDAARGPAAIPATTEPPRLTNSVNDDNRLPRNYSLQPPIIPHRIDGYQVDKNFNKCLDCHAREKTAFSQATPVSPTHYITRDGKVLDRISTRRYFCKQCHVPQEPVKPLVGNTFRGDPHDVDRTGMPEVPGDAAAAMQKSTQKSTQKK
jgi:nitrate reductase (cytochrome), electron transfer subunit